MVDAATLRARVEVQGVSQAQSQLRGFGSEIDRTGSQAQQAGGRFQGLLGPLQQISPVTLGAAGAVTALSAGVGKSIQSSIQWESSLAGVAKTLDDTGLSAAQFDQAVQDIGTDIRNMALEIPIAATELAGVAEAAGQLGIAREDVVSFTETMAKLGVATDLTAEQSAVAIARIANITGLATEDIDNFGSALVDLGNSSAATESEILDMATRIAASGTQAGFTEGEILGLAAALTSVGVRAEAGGTSVVTVMDAITTAVATSNEELAVFAEIAGQTAEEFAASWRAAPEEAFAAFVEGLGNVTAAGGDTVLILDELGLDGIRVAQALNSLAGAGDLTADSMQRGNTAMADANALNEEAARRFETTASKIQIAKNALNELGIIAGDVLAPGIADAAEKFAELVTEHRADFEALASTMGETAINAGELAASIAAILDNLAQVEGQEDQSFLGNQIQQTNEDIDELNSHISFTSKILRNEWPNQEEWQILLGIPWWLPASERAADFSLIVEDITADLRFMADVSEIVERAIRRAFGESTGPAEEFTTQLDELRAMGQEVASVTDDQTVSLIELANVQGENAIATLEAVNAHEAALSAYDLEAVHASILSDATMGLAGAYQQALGVMGAFNSQSSEFASTQSAIEKAIEAVQEKQEAGIPLSEKEISLIENHEEVLGRLVGGQQDATIEAGLAALAAGELMQAQDELNAAIESGTEDLEPYKQRVEDAEAALGNMGSATGETQSAQDDLTATIQGPLISAIDNLTRKVEYIAKPWLMEIDAATAAAEGEIQRLKDMIEAGAVLPVSIVTGGVSGPAPFAEGGISQGGMALVGEEGPELVFLPRGTEVMSNPESKRFIGAFQGGTGASLGAGATGIHGFFDAGAAAGADFGDGFDEAFMERWRDTWNQASQDVSRIFETDIHSLFDGTAVASAQASADAAKAFMEAWLELGFAPDAPAFMEAHLAYQEAMNQLEIIAAISGTEAAQAYWESFLEEMGVAIGGNAINANDPVPPFSEAVEAMAFAGLEALEEVLEEYPEAIGSIVDDILDLVADGSISYEEAMQLMAGASDDHLMPALERLEDQLAVDLAEAIIKYGPNSPEVQAILAGLGLIEDAMGLVGDAAGDMAFEIGLSVEEAMQYLQDLQDAYADAAADVAGGLTDEQNALIQGDSNIVAEGDGGGPTVHAVTAGPTEPAAHAALIKLANGNLQGMAATTTNAANTDLSDWIMQYAGQGHSVKAFPENIVPFWGQDELDEINAITGGKSGFVEFDQGGYTLPFSGGRMAMLHGDEYITGGQQIDMLANKINAAGGGGDIHITIHATEMDPHRLAEQIRFTLMSMRPPPSMMGGA